VLGDVRGLGAGDGGGGCFLVTATTNALGDGRRPTRNKKEVKEVQRGKADTQRNQTTTPGTKRPEVPNSADGKGREGGEVKKRLKVMGRKPR